MTKQQAKKLKKNDWVWTYKVGMYGLCWDTEAFTPLHCYVYVGPEMSSGTIRLCRITDNPIILTSIDKVFLTKEEAQQAMLKELDEAIHYYEHENEVLMSQIEDDLRFNNTRLSELNGLKATLERSMQ